MTDDMGQIRQRLVCMAVLDTLCLAVAVSFAIAHFLYGVGWALWGFIGFLGAAFAVQVWFVRGVARGIAKKGG